MFSLCLKFSPFLFNFIYFFRLFPFISCYICLSHSFDSNAIVVDINFFECVCVSAHKTPNNRNEITSHSRAHLINFSIFYNLLSISNPASSPLDTWVCFDFLILWISYALFSHFFWFFFSLVYQMMFENCRLVHFPRFILRTRTFLSRYVNLQKANRAIEPIPNSFSRIFFSICSSVVLILAHVFPSHRVINSTGMQCCQRSMSNYRFLPYTFTIHIWLTRELFKWFPSKSQIIA